jgi:hypothetical protein
MKREAINHPKLDALVDTLSNSFRKKAVAVRILETLWAFTAKYTPAGNVGKYSDREIAAWCGWPDDARRITDALVRTGWLDEHPDHRLVAHDWHDHADDTVHRSMVRAEKLFVNGVPPKTNRCTIQERTDHKEFIEQCARRFDDVQGASSTECVNQAERIQAKNKPSLANRGGEGVDEDALRRWFDREFVPAFPEHRRIQLSKAWDTPRDQSERGTAEAYGCECP